MDWGQLNKQRLATVHPILAARVQRLIEHLESKGYKILVTQALRTAEEQHELYLQGRETPGPVCRHGGHTFPVGTCKIHPHGLTVTNADAGHSWHCPFGLAVDIVPGGVSLQPDWNTSHPAWKETVNDAAQFGLKSGALWRTFQDFPHLQPSELQDSPNNDWRTLYDIQKLQGCWDMFSKMVSIREQASAVKAGS